MQKTPDPLILAAHEPDKFSDFEYVGKLAVNGDGSGRTLVSVSWLIEPFDPKLDQQQRR